MVTILFKFNFCFKYDNLERIIVFQPLCPFTDHMYVSIKHNVSLFILRELFRNIMRLCRAELLDFCSVLGLDIEHYMVYLISVNSAE